MGAVFSAEGNILVIRLEGEVDHYMTERMREKADFEIEQNGKMHLVFDFSGVNLMDSSGIGFVMGRYQKVCERGGQAVIIGVNAYVNTIFEMSGIYQIIRRSESLESAFQLIKGER